MTRVLQHHMRSDTGSADLKHFLFQNEVLAPELFNVSPDGTSNWSKIVETSAPSVDLKALEENVASFYEIVQ